MRFSTTVAVLSLAVGFASAQSKCAAQTIVDLCVSQQKVGYDACGGADYNCKCVAARIVRRCYDNCPDNTDRNGWDSIVLTCDAQYPATIPSQTWTASSTTSTSSTGSATSSGSGSTSSGSTSTDGAEEAADEGAASLAGPASGLMAAALALVAFA